MLKTVTLEEEQQKFKKRIVTIMKLQNKRYQKALNIIEDLNSKILELESGTKSDSKVKTTSKIITNNSENNSKKLDELIKNTEIKKMFSKYLKCLENVLNFKKKIDESDYKKKILDFIDSEERENQIILAKSSKMIEEFISDNLNPDKGIPFDNYYIKLLDLLDGILDVSNLNPNLIRIEQIVSKKINKKDLFFSKDLNKLQDKIRKNIEMMNLKDIDPNTQLFRLNDDRMFSLKNLQEIKDDVLNFSLTKNPILS